MNDSVREAVTNRMEQLMNLGMSSDVFFDPNGGEHIGVKITDPLTQPLVPELTELSLALAKDLRQDDSGEGERGTRADIP